MISSREVWDLEREAPEVAEHVEGWRLEEVQEGAAWSLVGGTPINGSWWFVLVKFDRAAMSDQLKPGTVWGYDGTATKGAGVILHLKPEAAERIWKHAEGKLVRDN